MIIDTNCFDQIIISTDSDEVKRHVLKIRGCEIHNRASFLSDDYTGTQAVLKNACEEMAFNDNDLICCIYPTAIFLTAEILSDSLRKHIAANCPFTFAVKEYAHPINRSFSCVNQRVNIRDRTAVLNRTQDLKKQFHDAGYFYWGCCKYWKEMYPIIYNGNQTYILKKNQAIDIDDQDDWDFAESMWTAIHE